VSEVHSDSWISAFQGEAMDGGPGFKFVFFNTFILYKIIIIIYIYIYIYI